MTSFRLMARSLQNLAFVRAAAIALTILAVPGVARAQSGWTLVSSLADVVGDNTSPYGGNARDTGATVASSWWMIAAFNTTLNTHNSCKTNNSGGTVAESAYAAGQGTNYSGSAKCDDGDDAFKLNWLKTTVASGGG